MAGVEPLPEPPAGATARRPATEAEAQALASALRLRILRLCLDEALTNKDIARRLGRDPASVLHHVRRLVDTGFLEPLPVRRGSRGARERPYRATGKSWRISIGDRNREHGAMLEAFLDELNEAGVDAAEFTRLGLTLDAAHHAEFLDRLQQVFDEFADRAPDPDGDRWSVFFAIHPDMRGRRR